MELSAHSGLLAEPHKKNNNFPQSHKLNPFLDKHEAKMAGYDLAHHESPIAQWLERPTGIWKVMGSTPVGGSNSIHL